MTARCGDMTTGLSGSVSAGYLSGIVSFAAACGADRSALLAAVGLDNDMLTQAETRLPLAMLPRLFDVASRALGDHAFALRFGVGVPCGELTLASALAAAQPEAKEGDGPRTLRDALDGLNRYASLGVHFGDALSGDRYRFTDDTDGVWLEDLRPCRDGYAWPALTESVFARFATGIRRRGGEQIVRALEVTHDEPCDAVHRAAYEHVFRVPVRFGAPRNALCLDPAFLERPLEPLASTVQTVLERHAQSQLRRLGQTHAAGTWTARVQQVLRHALANHEEHPSPPVSVHDICRTLAMSRQTLHRRLRNEGTTFAALYDRVRCEQAETLLQRHGVTVSAVAARLGFSEAAAFSRAYKRWTGQRPGAKTRASVATT